RLEFKDMSKGEYRAEIRALHVLEQIPTLQHLHITLSLDRDHIHQQWVRTLKALPRLESLTLTCHRLVNGIHLQEVLQACCGLQSLSLKLLARQKELEQRDRQMYKDTRAAIERMPEMRLRELVLEAWLDIVVENIFQPLLERCPRMEKLLVESQVCCLIVRHLAKTLKENKLPDLRHLTLDTNFTESNANGTVDVALSCITRGLGSLVLQGFYGDLFIQPLIEHHSRSLTTLDMLQTPISLWAFSDLMAGLPCLRTVRADMDQDQYDFEDILPLDKEWKCIGLRNLELELGISETYYTIGDAEWKGSVAKVCIDYVFSQVAKLTSLQELAIGSEQDMYCKNYGYLEQLAGLKHLKVMHLAGAVHWNFDKYHALWMAQNWPKLLQVYELELPVIFKRTLRKERPLIEF
ncbi:hypothetical protein BGX34_006411, partial [Mortierella sp. NVP85]